MPSRHMQVLLNSLVGFQCDPATHYNELASLFFTDADTAIKQLFHFREVGPRHPHVHPPLGIARNPYNAGSDRREK